MKDNFKPSYDFRFRAILSKGNVSKKKIGKKSALQEEIQFVTGNTKSNIKVERAVQAAETLLEKGKGLLKRTVDNFTADENGKIKGITIGLAAEAIAFVFKHPIATFNLFRFARTPELHNLDSVTRFVENDKIWGAIKNNIKELPGFGENLAKQGIKEFKPGGILDKEGLERLTKVFEKDKNIETVRNNLREITKQDGDWNKVIIQSLSLLSQQDFIDYFKSKKEAIHQYFTKDRIDEIHSNLSEYKDIMPAMPDGWLNVVSDLLVNIPQIKETYIKFNDEGPAVAAFEALHMVNKDKNLSKFFSTHPSIVSEIAISAIEKIPELQAAAEQFHFNPKILKAVDIILKDPKFSKKLTLLFHQEDFVSMAEELLAGPRKDEVIEYIKDNKAYIIELTQFLSQQVPEMKLFIPAGLDIQPVIYKILSEPQKIGDSIKTYKEQGKGVTLKNILEAFNINEMLGALEGSIVMGLSTLRAGAEAHLNQTSSFSSPKQKVVNEVLEYIATNNKTVTKADNKIEKNNFTELGTQGLNRIKKNEETSDLAALANNPNGIYDYAMIKPIQGDEVLKLDNLTFNNQSFVGAKFENVSFKNSQFINTSFLGAEFADKVSFEGASMDKATLQTLLTALKEKEHFAGYEHEKPVINLEKVKLVGDFTNIDLSGISLRNCDLSNVTSLKNVNLKNTDFNDAKLPDAILFKDSYNIESAKFSKAKSIITDDIIRENNAKLVKKAIKQIVALVEREGRTIKSQELESLRSSLGEVISAKSLFGLYIKQQLQQDPSCKLPILNPQGLQDTAEFQGRAGILTAIYNSTRDGNLKTTLAGNFVSSLINEKLFQEGRNCGQGGYYIKEKVEESFRNFAKKNPSFLELFEKEKECNNIRNHLLKSIELNNFKGIEAMDPIKFESSTLSKEQRDKIDSELSYVIDNNFSNYKLSERDKKLAANLAPNIGHNLFGSGIDGDRKEDVKLIEHEINKALLALKKQNYKVDDIIKIDGTNDLPKSSSRINMVADLTKLFYDNSSYTKMGLLTGGIYLDAQKLDTNFAEEVQNILGQKLFQGPNIESPEEGTHSHIPDHNTGARSGRAL